MLHYSFDRTAGGTAIDLSGNGNNGRIEGATPNAEGRPRNSLFFNGVDSVIEVPASRSLDVKDALSVAMFFKVQSYAEQRPILEWFNTNPALNAPFAYQITATGQQPIGFTSSALPPAWVTQATWGLKPSTCWASFSSSDRGTNSGK